MILSLEKNVALQLRKIASPFTQGCFVPRLVEIVQVILEKKNFKFRKCVFSLFHNYLPLEKGGALHLNKLKCSSPKDALCQVWLKLAQWFWRIYFLNFVIVFSLFVKLSPLGKGLGPSFEHFI